MIIPFADRYYGVNGRGYSVSIMQIAFLSREYPPDTAWGGVSSYCDSLSCALAARGHDVHFICQAVTGPSELERNGVRVYRVGYDPGRYSARARIDYSFHAWLKLRELIKKHRVEVVVATHWGAEAFLYSLRKKVPLVVTLDVSAADIVRTGNYSGISQLLSLKLLSVLENFSLRRADRVIAISKELYSCAVSELHVAPERLDMVNHGVDTEIYRPVSSDARERLSIRREDPLVLFAGRLESRKGIDILYKTLPEVVSSRPSARFVLVGADTATAPGGGSFKEYLQKRAEADGFSGNLMILDYMPPEELIKLYSACDVFVLPSLQESFGMVVVEAMACGCPVVATLTGGVADIGLEPPGGIAVPPGNVFELARAILSLLSLDESGKLRVAGHNRELVQAKFSISAWIDRTVGVYERAVKRKQR